MAKVKIQDIIEHLDHEMKKSLEPAVQRSIPDAVFDKGLLYKEFCKAVGRNSSTWIEVRDDHVEIK